MDDDDIALSGASPEIVQMVKRLKKQIEDKDALIQIIGQQKDAKLLFRGHGGLLPPLLPFSNSHQMSPTGSKSRQDIKAFVRHDFNSANPCDNSDVESIIWMLHERCQEATIAAYVKTFLTDIIALIPDLNKDVKVMEEVTLGRIRPDLWLVFQHNIPKGVIEVKNSNDETVLNKPSVLGQLYDYMLRLRAVFGVEKVFGIVTTFAKWRICWFADADDYANRDETTVDHGANTVSPAVAIDLNDRILHGTGILDYQQGSPSISQYILAAFVKMLRSPVDPPLDKTTHCVKPGKGLVLLRSDLCYWEVQKSQHKINLDFENVAEGDEFYVLACMGKGISGTVWLCCNNNWDAVAIKFFHDPEKSLLSDANHEADCWKNVYGINARVTILAGAPALIMPYFEPLNLRTPITTERSSKISFMNENVVSDLELFRDTATTVIDEWIAKGYYHDDVALRNFGVKKNGSLILLDMGGCKKIDEADTTSSSSTWCRDAMLEPFRTLESIQFSPQKKQNVPKEIQGALGNFVTPSL